MSALSHLENELVTLSLRMDEMDRRRRLETLQGDRTLPSVAVKDDLAFLKFKTETEAKVRELEDTQMALWKVVKRMQAAVEELSLGHDIKDAA